MSTTNPTTSDGIRIAILSCSSSDTEYNGNNDYAVVELDHATVRVILQRMNLVGCLQVSEPALQELTYQDYRADFLSSSQFNMRYGWEVVSDQSTPMVVALATLHRNAINADDHPDDEAVLFPDEAIEYPHMVVTSNEVWWTGLIGSSAIHLETDRIERSPLEALLAEPVEPPAVALVMTGDQIGDAWPAASSAAALRTLRAWYAVRRHIYLEDCDTATDRAQEEAAAPDPATATLELINDWYASGDAGYGVFLAPLCPDPLTAGLAELGASPDPEESQKLRTAVAHARGVDA